MKVERKEAKFEPVVITLESQEEVDQMYYILRYVEVENTPMDSMDCKLYEFLEELVVGEYRSEYDEEDHNIILTKI